MNGAVNCVMRQPLLEVFSSPFNDFHHTIMSVFDAMLPESQKSWASRTNLSPPPPKENVEPIFTLHVHEPIFLLNYVTLLLLKKKQKKQKQSPQIFLFSTTDISSLSLPKTSYHCCCQAWNINYYFALQKM